MSRYIKNFATLATTPARTDALAIAEAGLQAIDTSAVLREQLTITDGVLSVGGHTYTLSSYKNIYIVGFGKVSCTAAYTLEQIFDGTVRAGAVVGITEKVCQVVDTYAGTHPIPSSRNYTATKHIAAIAQSATADDLVLVVVSGGGSALLCSSMGECEQSTKLFSAFLSSGGTIEELNTVRKHLSTLKGGGLAAALHPATVIGLVFSDVPGGDLAAVASGPTYFDTSTKAQAQAIIDRYDLGVYSLNETPKDETLFERVVNIPLVTNERALTHMELAAAQKGYQTHIVGHDSYTTPEETEALFTAAAAPNTVLLMGGETKIVVPDNCVGKGGRNSFLALHMLDHLATHDVFVSLASDGKDNTEVAGAIVDQHTRQKAAAAALQPAEYKACLNSFPFFAATDDHITTGPLESNVSDLMIYLSPTLVAAPTAPAITGITATVIKDSRGQPTIRVTVQAGTYEGTFSVPSGASTGAREVYALPAKQAVKQIKTVLAPALRGLPVDDQAAIDARLHELDTSAQFTKIGGNSALGVSVAALKAAAAAHGQETYERVAALFAYRQQAAAPRLFVNLINGGEHATVGSQIQEHQIIPETDDVAVAFRTVCAVQRALRDVISEDFSKRQITIGDEGGFAIPTTSVQQPFEYLHKAVVVAADGVPVSLGADIAASSFANETGYQIDDAVYDQTALLDWYQALHTQLPQLRYVEDPASEHDEETFVQYQRMFPEVTTIGDDLTTTNVAALRAAIEVGAMSGIIIKPNQIGTVTDTLATMALAYEHDIKCIVSHRSGETMDDFIADLAWGTKCFGLKAGAPTAKERRVKYDRLLSIVKS